MDFKGADTTFVVRRDTKQKTSSAAKKKHRAPPSKAMLDEEDDTMVVAASADHTSHNDDGHGHHPHASNSSTTTSNITSAGNGKGNGKSTSHRTSKLSLDPSKYHAPNNGATASSSAQADGITTVAMASAGHYSKEDLEQLRQQSFQSGVVLPSSSSSLQRRARQYDSADSMVIITPVDEDDDGYNDHGSSTRTTVNGDDNDDDDEEARGIPSQLDIMRARAKRERLRARGAHNLLEPEQEDDFIPLSSGRPGLEAPSRGSHARMGAQSEPLFRHQSDPTAGSTLIREDECDVDEEPELDDDELAMGRASGLRSFGAIKGAAARPTAKLSRHERATMYVHDDLEHDHQHAHDRLDPMRPDTLRLAPPSSADASAVTLEEVKRQLQSSIDTLRERQHHHTHRLTSIDDSLTDKTKALGTLEARRAELGTQHVFYLEMRDYLRDLLACISDKEEQIAALEDRLLQAITQRYEAIKAIRATEAAESAPTIARNAHSIKWELDLDQQHLADNLELQEYQHSIGEIQHEAQELFADALPEYSLLSEIKAKFLQWRISVRERTQTYESSARD